MGLDDSIVVTPPRPLDVAEVRVGRAEPVGEPIAERGAGGFAVAAAVSPARPVSGSRTVDPPAQPPAAPAPAAPPAAEPIAPPPIQPVPLPVPTSAVAPPAGAGAEEPPPDRGLSGGGNELACGDGALLLYDGCEYAFAVSFFVPVSAEGEGVASSPIVQLVSEGSDSAPFGLWLGAYPGDEWQSGGRGLWSSGEAMGGERFLAPVQAGLWHQAIVHLLTTSRAEGFYEVFLDGQPVDARGGVSLIAPGSAYAEVEVGLGGTLEPDLP